MRRGRPRARPIEFAKTPELPQILPDIGAHGIPKGSRGDFQYAVELVGRAVSSDKGDAKSVDDLLHDHAAHGDDGVLQRHREPQTNQNPIQFPLKAEIFLSQEENSVFRKRAQAKSTENACAITVAKAAPATPQGNTTTNRVQADVASPTPPASQAAAFFHPPRHAGSRNRG